MSTTSQYPVFGQLPTLPIEQLEALLALDAEKLHALAEIAEGNDFVVTLTPTAEDFSGTTDKTGAEITAAHEAGKRIVFNVVGFLGFDHVHIPAAWYTYATNHTICAACATLVDITSNLQIVIITADGSDNSYYSTELYPLTPAS